MFLPLLSTWLYQTCLLCILIVLIPSPPLEHSSQLTLTLWSEQGGSTLLLPCWCDSLLGTTGPFMTGSLSPVLSVYTCLYVCGCSGLCVCGEARGQPQVPFIYPASLRHGLFLGLSSPNWEPPKLGAPRIRLLYFFNARITNVHYHPIF